MEPLCIICSVPFQGYGHNPAPVKNMGRCCDTCNTTRVIPTRLAYMFNRFEEDL